MYLYIITVCKAWNRYAEWWVFGTLHKIVRHKKNAVACLTRFIWHHGKIRFFLTMISTQSRRWTSLKLKHEIFRHISKLATIVEGNPKAPFSIATTPRCRGGRYSFPGLLYFTHDPYLIMLSVKQEGIKYHFLSLWYDPTWDWTQVFRAIGEHSNR